RSCFPIFGADGTPAAVGGVVVDLTDVVETAQALRESRDLLRLITDTIDDVFWMESAELDRMFYVSPAYESIWGRSCESLYENPRSYMEAVHPDDLERMAS